jgi:DNA-binding NtrC family response regulator
MVEGCQILVSKYRYLSIVDDESDITMLFHDALKSIPGITIFSFTEPQLALAHFITNKSLYFLVIADFRMPELNGMELLKKIKDLNPFVRTILMTAFSLDDKLLKEYGKRQIINVFLQKPIRLDDLRDEVNNQLHTSYIRTN